MSDVSNTRKNGANAAGGATSTHENRCRCGGVGRLFCPRCGEIIGADAASFGSQGGATGANANAATAALQAASRELKAQIAQFNAAIARTPAPNDSLQGLFDRASKIKQVVEAFAATEAAHAAQTGSPATTAAAQTTAPDNQTARALAAIAQEAQSFLQEKEELQIALVGAIRAGKSTLINALLGREYASVQATTETATVTKFKKGDKPQMRVSFYSREEWAQVFAGAAEGTAFKKEFEKLGAERVKNEFVGREDIVEPLNIERLRAYTSSKHPQHYFVKEVEVSYPEFPFARNIVFVDTPGLGDPVPYRSEATKDYIKSAKVVLMCVLARVLNAEDVKNLAAMFGNMGGECEKVYVLATQYDSLNDPQRDWAEQKADWTKHLQSYYATPELAEKNIIAVSGRTALLCELYRQGALDEKGNKDLKKLCYIICDDDDVPANLARLEEFAHVAALKSRINEDILEQAQRIVESGVKTRLDNLLSDAREFFARGAAQLAQAYDANGDDLEGINARLAASAQELAQHEQLMSQMQRQFGDFEARSKGAIATLGEQISNLIRKI